MADGIRNSQNKAGLSARAPDARKVWMPGDPLTENAPGQYPQRSVHPRPMPIGRRAFLSGVLAGVAIVGCGGKMPDMPSRNFWLPAFLLRPDPASGTLSLIKCYGGIDSFDLLSKIGIESGYPSIDAIPEDVYDRQFCLTSILSGFLSTRFDFSDPRVQALFDSIALLYMTNKNYWPNGVLAENAGIVGGLEIATTAEDIYSDCSGGSGCAVKDILALNNKHDFFPSTETYTDLPEDEVTALITSNDSLAQSMVEETLHAFKYTAMGSRSTEFDDLMNQAWEAASVSSVDDQILADAWQKGFVARAISEDGIGDYSLRQNVLGTLQYLFGSADPKMEAAILSILQLLGSNADIFMGSAGRSYLDLYSSQTPGLDYLTYRRMFASREAFTKIGGFDYDLRPGFPALMRPFYEPFARPWHLDVRFSNGFANPLFGQNPYLSDYDSVISLIQNVVTRVIEHVKV